MNHPTQISTTPTAPFSKPTETHEALAWLHLERRLKQLRDSGALVLVDLDAMTLTVLGKTEYLRPSAQ